MTGHPGLAGLTEGLASLGPAARQLGEAEWLLGEASDADIVEAREKLHMVEGLLGALVSESWLTSENAARLLVLRDVLSVHLSAAATLTSLDLGARATAVLQRAVSALRSGLEGLAEQEVAGACAVDTPAWGERRVNDQLAGRGHSRPDSSFHRAW
ncbi:MAG: hypothetical protein ACR2HY_09290 [Acidimicrobiales bacterium]